MADKNIAELEMLRRQLQQLHESFTAVINETRPDNPNLISWPDLLSKFNILAAKYSVLNQAISKKHAGLLKEMSVAPKTRPGSIHEQNIVSVLLRTKLAPEIEQEEEEIRARAEAELQQDRKLDWSARAEKHESLAVSALSTFLEQRRKHAVTVDALVNEKLAKAKEDADVEMDSAQGTPEGGEEVKVTLEDVLAFMSSGVEV
ncbi:hypothetical protein LPJ53_001889 [Coemansia erecta]|uniref:Mediator of RNA polymerase II transcription subunit 8 n=1 Tax=Coemansia erecta TaxID=147472 RepID=A0A9W8CRQ5_9FUNG|nr:hypothetical protein LPJ53_001889 [Coemansia erecta]